MFDRVALQDLMRLKQVKSRIQTQCGREPTFIEWAEAVGISCTKLQAQINNCHRCREKLVLSNLRMVVHVAKLYQGRGMGLQDLLQVSQKQMFEYIIIRTGLNADDV